MAIGSGEASASGSAETEPATRTVSTAFGEVEVPRHPQRVAAISYLGTVLALGTQPVAWETFLMPSPYLKGMLDDIEDVGDSLEKLLAMEPNLIITHNPNQEAIDQYKRIVPTVSVPYNAFASIQEEMRYFGELLDQDWLSVHRKTRLSRIGGSLPQIGVGLDLFQRCFRRQD